MNNWLTYLLEVSICHALFFLVYYVFLRNLSFFQINRIFLLVITLLGFIIPLLDIPVSNNITTEAVAPFTLNLQNLTLNDPVLTNTQEEASTINWLLILIIVYVLGVSVRLWKLSSGISKVLKLIRANEITDYKGLKTIYLNDNSPSFFTFFNYLFINDNKDISTNEMNKIIAHEKVHLLNNHTLDNLIMELSIVLCWFNPITYFLKRELNHVHEFYADQVANENGNIEDYSRLILRLSSGENHQYLTHQFSMKNIKKRIIMLNKNQNQRSALLRYFSIVPCLIILLSVFSCDYNESVPAYRTVDDLVSSEINADIQEPPPQILEPFNHLAEKYFGSNFLLSDILIQNLDRDIESAKLSWSSDEIRSHIIQLFKEKNISESDLSSLNNFLDEWNVTVISNGELKPSMVFEIPDYLRDNKRNIGSISWYGNTLYSDEHLTNSVGIKKGDFFNEEAHFTRLNNNPDSDDLASLYMDKGYLFFSMKIKKINRDGNVDLVFEINEGDVFTVSQVRVAGNNKVKDEEILKMIGIKDGDIFNRSKLLESQKEIAGSGLFDPANVNPNLVPNPIEKTVEIEFQVSEL